MTEWTIIGAFVGIGVIALVVLTWMLLNDSNYYQVPATPYPQYLYKEKLVKITPVFKTAPLERIELTLAPHEADTLRAVLEHVRHEAEPPYYHPGGYGYTPYAAYGPFINQLHAALRDTLSSAAK